MYEKLAAGLIDAGVPAGVIVVVLLLIGKDVWAAKKSAGKPDPLWGAIADLRSRVAVLEERTKG